MMVPETLAADMPRHSHASAYAALVIRGGYEEAGDRGRLNVRAGDVVLHECFEAHLDRIERRGAQVVNVALPPSVHVACGHGAISDPDRVLAEPRETAGALLLSLFKPAPRHMQDWPDLLAAELNADPFLDLGRWSDKVKLSPWTVSRGFQHVFGISPSRFRLRARTRRAWNAIRITRVPLAAIAASCGFADQAHMTRAVRALTGVPPMAWRCCK